MERGGCDECQATTFEWMDDDGVLRCQDCHTNVATGWGGDYDLLLIQSSGKRKGGEK